MELKHFLEDLNNLRTLGSCDELSEWGKDKLKEYDFILTELNELKKLRVGDVSGSVCYCGNPSVDECEPCCSLACTLKPKIHR